MSVIDEYIYSPRLNVEQIYIIDRLLNSDSNQLWFFDSHEVGILKEKFGRRVKEIQALIDKEKINGQ